MGDFIEKLTFERLLRIALPGVMCISIALWVYPELRVLWNGDRGFFDATAFLVLSLFIGTLIQSIHRGFLYAIIVRIIYARVAGKCCDTLIQTLCPFRLTDTDIRNYRVILEWRDRDKKLAEWMNGWASQIHFTWGNGYGAITGALLPWVACSPNDERLCRAVIGGIILLVIAYADDCRYMHFQVKRNPELSKCPNEGVSGNGCGQY